MQSRRFTLYWQDLLRLYLFIGIWLWGVFTLPNGLWSHEAVRATLLIGAIGIWRYSWWMINLSRALTFGRVVYPKMRKKADELWQTGWRPAHLHFLVTTYHERPATTHKYLEALIRELRRENLTATLWVGLGAKEDETVIKAWMESVDYDGLDVVLVRQNLPGKRCAIAITLRAMSRRGVGPNDIAFLMDGDSILDRGALQKCTSLFGADPELTALTTDEEAVVYGPKWTQSWLTMRFAQRRMWMQSHAMSGKVLTLTGRMSAFPRLGFGKTLLHPYHRSRFPRPLVMGTVPLPFRRRQKHLVQPPKGWC